MGRKKLYEAVLQEELARLQLEGLSFNEAFSQAWKLSEKAEEERRNRRREDNAWYQEQYRSKVKWTSGLPLKTVVLYLPETTLAVLDREAKEVQEVVHGTSPLVVWRSAVVIQLLGQLADSQKSHKKADRVREKKISSCQIYIQQ